MKQVFLLLFCCFTCNLFSQTDSLRGVSLFDKNRDIVVTNPIYNKGQIILFASEKDTTKSAVLFMITMDTCGNVLKNQGIKLNGIKEINVRHGASYYTKRNVAISTTDGGFYISALIDNKFASIKLDSIGGIQFIYYSGYREFPIESKELKDGYLSVIEYFPDPDPPSPRTVLLTKVDKNGKEKWSYWYNHGFFIACEILGDSTYYLLQTDSDGGVKLYTINQNGDISKIVKDSVDENTITGIWLKNKWILTESKWVEHKAKQYYREGIAAFDNQLQPLWHSYPPLINPTTNVPANQGIINLYSSNNAIYAHTSFGIGESKDLYEGLIKFDSNGKFQWMQQDSMTNCNNDKNTYLGEFYTGIAVLPSGSIFISGVSITDKLWTPKMTPWFSKLNSNGKFARNCKTLSEVNKNVNEEKWLIYPNPSSQFFEIKNNDLQAGKNYIVHIYDINSKLIHQQSINAITTFINTDNWTNGIYLYVIYENENIIHGGKWVKI